MHLLSYLLILASLLKIVCADIIEARPDIIASLNMANVPLLTRIDRIMQIDYRYQLEQSNTWTRYPDMKTVFTLPFSQHVKFHYSIVIGSQIACVLATRVKIDGKQIKQMRQHTYLIQWPSFSVADEYYVLKGSHTVVLQYRTNCRYTMDPNKDWPNAYFRVSYYDIPASR